MTTVKMASYISQRGFRCKGFVSGLGFAEVKYLKNPYDEQTNPEGIINLGTSVNRLMFDVLSEKFNDPSLHEVQEKYTHYGDVIGYESFRLALAGFLNHYMKPVKPIKTGDLITLNGCGTVVETLGTVLGDPGDGFLLPAPYYGGFVRDLTLRPGIKLVPVNLPSEPTEGQTSQYELTVDILEKAYDDATKQGITIRALLLCNPNNPIGYVHTEKQILEYLQFAHRHGIHVLLDEVYLLSVFKEGCTMKCVLSYDDIPDPERLHVIWGLSKDFCVSGFRCGVLHTVNQDVKDSIQQFAEFQSVSPLVQHMFTHILNDLDWIEHVYIPTNRKRLRECYKMVCETLRTCGIPFVEAAAGFYIWADFRQFLKHKTHDDEWRLFDSLLDNKLYILPGNTFHSDEPGWFRIVFAQKPQVLKLAMNSLSKAADALRMELKQ